LKKIVDVDEQHLEVIDYKSLAIMVVLAALADSINPCIFMLFTLLLILALTYFGTKYALKAGLMFTLAIFTTYYLIGLGLVHILNGTSAATSSTLPP